MLEEQCPETGAVPLMRNKDGRKFSVATNKFVDDDANTAPAMTVASADESKAPTPRKQGGPQHQQQSCELSLDRALTAVIAKLDNCSESLECSNTNNLVETLSIMKA